AIAVRAVRLIDCNAVDGALEPGLDAGARVARLEVQIHLVAGGNGQAATGIEVPPGRDLCLTIDIETIDDAGEGLRALGGRVARFQVHAKADGLADRNVVTHADAQKAAALVRVVFDAERVFKIKARAMLADDGFEPAAADVAALCSGRRRN